VNCSNCGRFVDDATGRALRDVCPHCGGRLRSGRGGSALRDSRVLRFVVTFALTSLAGLLLLGPAYRTLRYSSMRSEVRAQLSAIRMAEKTYRDEWGTYLSAAPTPAQVPAAETVPFLGPGLDAFQQLGWAPAAVPCRYSVLQVTDATSSGDDWFEASAECDMDGDGERAVFRTTADSKPYRDTPRDVY